MDFQAAAGWQGQHFDRTCRFVLRQLGAKSSERPFLVPDLGVEIDAEVCFGDAVVWSEFKGSYQGSRPGLMRTDTVKKAICSGALLAAGDFPPYVIFTSHLPVIDSSGDRMLAAAMKLGYVAQVVNVHDPESLKAFAARWTSGI